MILSFYTRFTPAYDPCIHLPLMVKQSGRLSDSLEGGRAFENCSRLEKLVRLYLVADKYDDPILMSRTCDQLVGIVRKRRSAKQQLLRISKSRGLSDENALFMELTTRAKASGESWRRVKVAVEQVQQAIRNTEVPIEDGLASPTSHDDKVPKADSDQAWDTLVPDD